MLIVGDRGRSGMPGFPGTFIFISLFIKIDEMS